MSRKLLLARRGYKYPAVPTNRQVFRLAGFILAIVFQLYAEQKSLPPGVTEVCPRPSKTYATTPLLPQYKDEQVRYINPAERENYRLRFGSDGLIYDASAHRFDTSNAVRIDEHGRKSFLKLAMFVMDAQGNFYASNFQQVGVFHHSSFVGGGEVAASGEMKVTDGKLELINDRSGHYRCSREFSEQALERLKQLLPGRTIERLHIEWFPPQ